MVFQKHILQDSSLTAAIAAYSLAAVILPFLIGKAMEDEEDYYYDSDELTDVKINDIAFFGGLYVAALPISVLIAPVTVPLFAVGAKKSSRECLHCHEDLTED